MRRRSSLSASVLAAALAACPKEQQEDVPRPEPVLTNARLVSEPPREGTVSNLEFMVDLSDPQGDVAALVVELYDDSGGKIGEKVIRTDTFEGEPQGAISFGGPVWGIPGGHQPASVRVRAIDEGRHESLPIVLSFAGASLTSDVQEIHDCITIANGVGAWAAGWGRGSFATNWCGGGFKAEGVAGAPMNCWDECCRLHDYCFGRGVDGYQTCHERLGNITTDCLHDCDKKLEQCWRRCSEIESRIDWTSSGASVLEGGVMVCPNGGPVRWCEWFREHTCDWEVPCAPPQATPVLRPSVCCAGALEECQACAGRDWGCSPIGSNWNDSYEFTPTYPPYAGCGEPCRGNLDCAGESCRFCAAGPDDVRRCESRECGGSCVSDEDDVASCWGIPDCEQCMDGRCRPRTDKPTWTNACGVLYARGCTESGSAEDAGSPDAGADAGPPDGGADGGPPPRRPDAGPAPAPAPDSGAVDAGPSDYLPSPDAGAGAGVCCCTFDVYLNGGTWVCVNGQQPSPALCYVPWPECCNQQYTICP